LNPVQGSARRINTGDRRFFDEDEELRCFGGFAGSDACSGKAENSDGAYASAVVP
jgi:hypothetical protein